MDIKEITALIALFGVCVIVLIGIIGLVWIMQDDRKDLIRRIKLEHFARWIAKQIIIENNEQDELDGVFIELTCRKLEKLGVVELIDGEYHYTEK